MMLLAKNYDTPEFVKVMYCTVVLSFSGHDTRIAFHGVSRRFCATAGLLKIFFSFDF